MEKVEVQDTESKYADARTPPPIGKEKAVIGSSCTWRDDKIKDFKVRVDRDVDVRKLIRSKFFVFDHIENYKDCIFPPGLTLTSRQGGTARNFRRGIKGRRQGQPNPKQYSK